MPAGVVGAVNLVGVLVLVAFALFYYTLEVHASSQMGGLRTRIDALYCSAITMTTVGYGGVHRRARWPGWSP